MVSRDYGNYSSVWVGANDLIFYQQHLPGILNNALIMDTL